MKRPKVGVGVIVRNQNGEILFGLRKNAHGEGTWGFPGGHLEFGEDLGACAIRETREETGIIISNPVWVAVTNDIFSTTDEHYMTVYMTCDPVMNSPQISEPHKCEKWIWAHGKNAPSPLFLPIQNLLKNDPQNTLRKEAIPFLE